MLGQSPDLQVRILSVSRETVPELVDGKQHADLSHFKMEERFMKLSEAIRLGSMMKPQAFGHLFDDEHNSSCAMGAAIDAIGRPLRPIRYNEVSGNLRGPAHQIPNTMVVDIPDEWFLMMNFSCHPCPACDMIGHIDSIIVHLNDTHLWTREKIADWVENVEKIIEAEKVVEVQKT